MLLAKAAFKKTEFQTVDWKQNVRSIRRLEEESSKSFQLLTGKLPVRQAFNYSPSLCWL